jgi:phosphoribosylanthranilate isomerase
MSSHLKDKKMKILVKVCGIKNIEDALTLEARGAEFLGFNFVQKSPRYIRPELAQEIIQELSPNTKAVAVLQNQTESEINAILELCPVDFLQFHGSESVELIQKFDLPKIKVFSITEDFDMESIKDYENVVDYFLFDSKVGQTEGGTGVTFDWTRILGKVNKPFFLAGGIGPENLRKALREVRPQGIDLNSKIEIKPGLKDHKLFVECMDIVEEFEN